MSKWDSALVTALKSDIHTKTFRNFVKLFDHILDVNHKEMDVSTISEIPNLQGQNQLLKKLINILTIERKQEFKNYN